MDKDPVGTKLTVPVGLTAIKILDYDETTFINFEADIQYPEEEGIIQVEVFGMHINEDGTLIYGMRVDAIQDRPADDTSLDMLGAPSRRGTGTVSSSWRPTPRLLQEASGRGPATSCATETMSWPGGRSGRASWLCLPPRL